MKPNHVLLATLLLAARGLAAAEADDLQPGVRTSESAAPAAAPAAAAAAQSAPVARPATRRAATPAPAAGGRPAAPGASPAAGNAHDRVELDTTQVTGNRELPNVMYVVPWKKPELGDFGGRPPKSLLDEVLEPVDRDVFRRQNRYYAALGTAAAPTQGAPAPPSGNAPAATGGQGAAVPAKGND